MLHILGILDSLEKSLFLCFMFRTTCIALSETHCLASKLFLWNLVENTIIPQIFYLECVKNHHYMDDFKVCNQFKQYTGPLDIAAATSITWMATQGNILLDEPEWRVTWTLFSKQTLQKHLPFYTVEHMMDEVWIFPEIPSNHLYFAWMQSIWMLISSAITTFA